MHNLYTLFFFSMFQIGESGKSTRELEKTIALLKKVVERTQQENESLKKSPAFMNNEQLRMIQAENQSLKVNLLYDGAKYMYNV